MRIYSYVGSLKIAENAIDMPLGASVTEPADILRWACETQQTTDADGCIIATFVVDESETLRVADRHSEHIACAGGRSVLSAGEITLRITRLSVEVVSVSNQSTGYCPEPCSWPSVSNALRRAGLTSPTGFEPAIEFRLCTSCSSINLVKNGIFECAICNSSLQDHWNVS